MKNKLKTIVFESSTTSGKVFDLIIQSLIILSLLTFSLETIKNQSQEFYKILRVIEVFTVLIFSLEYLLRVLLSDKKLKFIFSFYGIIDLLAIIPFYLSTGLDLRSIRALRLLRLFKFFRYNETILKIKLAWQLASKELTMFFCLTCILLYLSAVGIYYFEYEVQPIKFSSILDSLWWAVATLTTVGYGDVYPITTGGKLFTFFILMIGLGIVSIPAGVISSSLTKAREMLDKSKKR